MYNEDELLSQPEYAHLLREELREFARQIDLDKSTIFLPRLKGRWAKVPGSFFHLDMEVFFQLSGSCVFVFPSQRMVINPGDILLVPPGMPHEEFAQSRGGEIFRNIVYTIGDRGGSVHLAQSRRRTTDVAKSDLPFPAHMERLAAQRLYSAIADALGNLPSDNLPEVNHLRRSLLQSLILQSLLDLGCPESVNIIPSWNENAEMGKKHYKVALAKRIIHEHIMAPMPSVAELAVAVKCSPNHLSALFHEVTGMTVKNYINGMKLDYARKLIDTTTYNIAEIAWSCGFQDTAYFAKIFKKHFGRTPAELRSGAKFQSE